MSVAIPPTHKYKFKSLMLSFRLFSEAAPFSIIWPICTSFFTAFFSQRSAKIVTTIEQHLKANIHVKAQTAQTGLLWLTGKWSKPKEVKPRLQIICAPWFHRGGGINVTL